MNTRPRYRAQSKPWAETPVGRIPEGKGSLPRPVRLLFISASRLKLRDLRGQGQEAVPLKGRRENWDWVLGRGGGQERQ